MFLRSSYLFISLLFVFILTSLSNATGITVLAPINGGNVSSKSIIIIGMAGENVKEVEIKGSLSKNLKVKTLKGGFFAKVNLTKDKNDITISADDGSSLNLNIIVGKSGSFNYHPDESEVMDCTSTCHSKADTKGYSVQSAAAICYECHDANNEKAFVHGPVNMGICGVCHMPHGSNNESFLQADKKVLCSGCHDSLTSAHPDLSNKICIDCHDPHSSDKEFHIK